MYMKVLGNAVDCIGPGQKWCAPGRMIAYGNQGAYGTEAGQHPRLNRERDLWRGGVSLELLLQELLTSLLIIVSVLEGSLQPMQKRGKRLNYLRILVRALCSKTQNTTVIRTSAATVRMLIEEVGLIRSK